MTTGTHCTGMNWKLTTHTNRVTYKHTQAHTGKLDVHRQEAVCLMPVFFRQGCRREGGGRRRRRRDGEGVGGRWEQGKKQAEDESRRRATPIKNDSRRRTRQGTERKKSWMREKTERILTGEMEKKKWTEHYWGWQTRRDGEGGEKEEPKYPCTLIASI